MRYRWTIHFQIIQITCENKWIFTSVRYFFLWWFFTEITLKSIPDTLLVPNHPMTNECHRLYSFLLSEQKICHIPMKMHCECLQHPSEIPRMFKMPSQNVQRDFKMEFDSDELRQLSHEWVSAATSSSRFFLLIKWEMHKYIIPTNPRSRVILHHLSIYSQTEDQITNSDPFIYSYKFIYIQ